MDEGKRGEPLEPKQPRRTLSRRDFLKLAGGAAAGLALSACAPPPTSEAPTEPPSEPPPTEKPVEEPTPTPTSVPTPAPTENPPTPEILPNLEWRNIEGIEILCDESRTPFVFKKEEFDAYIREHEGEAEGLDPHQRLTNILVGSEAWRSWQNRERCQGEQLTHFLLRHIKIINEVMARTRLEAGIYQMKMIGRIILVEENDLQEMPLSTYEEGSRQESSKEVFSRWSIDVNYWPEGNSDLGIKAYDRYQQHQQDNLLYDDGLLHEWTHYVFFLFLIFIIIFKGLQIGLLY